MNLILSQNEAGTGLASGESAMSAGSATVVQRTLREHSAVPQHSGSWQSVRPSVKRSLGVVHLVRYYSVFESFEDNAA